MKKKSVYVLPKPLKKSNKKLEKGMNSKEEKQEFEGDGKHELSQKKSKHSPKKSVKKAAKKSKHKVKPKPFKGESEKNPKVKKFIEKRMHDFKEDNMHARVKKTGPVVTNPKQAIAIALSESRKKGAKIKKKNK